MKRKMIFSLALVMVFALFVGWNAPVMFAQTAVQEPAKVKDVGNKFCPVSGEPVSGTDFFMYEEKRYGVCCPMCEAMFKKDPAKYIKAMEEKEPNLKME
ncbi:MAG: hypothetical protein A3G33_04790 [Omnitrophica bacterium RIFCSPLOWO2_12_FULL_44_17]|uniref:TRASH domain-containing protein n=1 Tax=Candidatus Danuiimicrobium aquiferis TaxID=1801832 RepID=A0A1G1KQN0_9BACT|nr:MAG: hypothetical protein A3B72_11000 [Omnitrophica bacterium RIFCSPHIGHO2_02_FULL_45_28]OGW92472.1 MAG: hypothetical protein A3E74_06840 [Omnitrophica bacterium RIFCSPHIGHO2_12_FULL_44_12]OGW95250.1 MAG: hypothetical protein A3G33_04790 [Omnitrophica bacterium RIFCSPLOWO2_12_FULL_44_17]OGX02345.1 MAG: hypothetical protein A3J12_10125 [Omnitrophica bacterium RIFCSPLOWO2_02_FULL_44_11]